MLFATLTVACACSKLLKMPPPDPKEVMLPPELRTPAELFSILLLLTLNSEEAWMARFATPPPSAVAEFPLTVVPVICKLQGANSTAKLMIAPPVPDVTEPSVAILPADIAVRRR